jgi:hypothetical protein
MRSFDRPHKGVIIPLALLLAGVWGAIGFRIFAAINASPEANEPLPVRMDRAADSLYVYRIETRDPFFEPPRPKPVPKTKAAEIPWAPPKLKLTGVLASGRRLSAVLEDSTGNILLVCPGESLCGVKILDVSPRKVCYSYMKRNSEWKLEGD